MTYSDDTLDSPCSVSVSHARGGRAGGGGWCPDTTILSGNRFNTR